MDMLITVDMLDQFGALCIYIYIIIYISPATKGRKQCSVDAPGNPLRSTSDFAKGKIWKVASHALLLSGDSSTSFFS